MNTFEDQYTDEIHVPLDSQWGNDTQDNIQYWLREQALDAAPKGPTGTLGVCVITTYHRSTGKCAEDVKYQTWEDYVDYITTGNTNLGHKVTRVAEGKVEIATKAGDLIIVTFVGSTLDGEV